MKELEEYWRIEKEIAKIKQDLAQIQTEIFFDQEYLRRIKNILKKRPGGETTKNHRARQSKKKRNECLESDYQ